jgi:hypothetical protein
MWPLPVGYTMTDREHFGNNPKHLVWILLSPHQLSDNMRLTYVYLYRYVTLREEHTHRAFERRRLMRLFGTKRGTECDKRMEKTV